MENTLTINDKVEVLRGKHRGKKGVYRGVKQHGEYQILIVKLDGAGWNDLQYFGTGDLKKVDNG